MGNNISSEDDDKNESTLVSKSSMMKSVDPELLIQTKLRKLFFDKIFERCQEDYEDIENSAHSPSSPGTQTPVLSFVGENKHLSRILLLGPGGFAFFSSKLLLYLTVFPLFQLTIDFFFFFYYYYYYYFYFFIIVIVREKLLSSGH